MKIDPASYDAWYGTAVGSLCHRLERDALFSLVKFQPGDTVLDAGCGTGVYLEELLHLGLNVTGVDEDEDMLKYASNFKGKGAALIKAGDPEKILRTFGLNEVSGDVVEFGCGYGTFTLPAARLIGGTVYALDIESGMVERVTDRCKGEGIKNVKAEVRDFLAEGTGIPDSSVEAALLFNILHLEEPMTLMREAYRILKPGGRLAVIHWNFDPSTPRGPSLDIRPRPEQCVEWGKKAGFSSDESDRFDLKPYHYGLLFRKP